MLPDGCEALQTHPERQTFTFMSMSDCTWLQANFSTFISTSSETALLLHYPCFDLDSSSVDCDLLHNTALNAFIRGSANLWPSSQQDSGFLFMAV